MRLNKRNYECFWGLRQLVEVDNPVNAPAPGTYFYEGENTWDNPAPNVYISYLVAGSNQDGTSPVNFTKEIVNDPGDLDTHASSTVNPAGTGPTHLAQEVLQLRGILWMFVLVRVIVLRLSF